MTAGLFGWMCSSGVGELTDVGPGRFTGARYVDILEVLLPTVRAMAFPDQDPFYLVQDNSPIHTSRVVKNWFREHPEIEVLPHPPKSPDLNLLEHVWADMCKHMPNGCARRREIVVRNALRAWGRLGSDEGQVFMSEFVSSMRRRLKAVLEAGGGYTKY